MEAEMMDLISLFCSVDDFWIAFEKDWKKMLLEQGKVEPKKRSSLNESEIMTIVILFHMIGYRNFKTFYIGYVLKHLKEYFPDCPSYNRFVELKKTVLFPLYCYLLKQNKAMRGIGFVDSTSIAVCHVKRARSNRVFRKIAKKGRTSTGWFFGFTLHLIVNDQGHILSFMLTPGNVDDRTPVQKFVHLASFIGKLVGDRGYISSELFHSLFPKKVQLITKIKKNMKKTLMSLYDKLLLRKRGIIETIINQLKNISQIEHSRHRSPTNFLVNLIGALVVCKATQETFPEYR